VNDLELERLAEELEEAWLSLQETHLLLNTVRDLLRPQGTERLNEIFSAVDKYLEVLEKLREATQGQGSAQ
jgi:hypothetical protein